MFCTSNLISTIGCGFFTFGVTHLFNDLSSCLNRPVAFAKSAPPQIMCVLRIPDMSPLAEIAAIPTARTSCMIQSANRSPRALSFGSTHGDFPLAVGKSPNLPQLRLYWARVFGFRPRVSSSKRSPTVNSFLLYRSLNQTAYVHSHIGPLRHLEEAHHTRHVVFSPILPLLLRAIELPHILTACTDPLIPNIHGVPEIAFPPSVISRSFFVLPANFGRADVPFRDCIYVNGR